MIRMIDEIKEELSEHRRYKQLNELKENSDKQGMKRKGNAGYDRGIQ
jgi:hypothetical protein